MTTRDDVRMKDDDSLSSDACYATLIIKMRGSPSE